MLMLRSAAVAGLLTMLSGCLSAGVTPPTIGDPKDGLIRDAFIRHAREAAAKITVEHCKAQTMPEMFCWVELKQLGMSLTAYELTGDPTRLRDFVAGFENLRSVMTIGPDGFRGWYGVGIEGNRNPAKPDTVIDEIQTTFRAVGVMARFLELLETDKDLRKELAPLRDEYLALIETHLIKKWDARGSFVDLGSGGAIYRWNPAYTPRRANLTLAFEKQAIILEGWLNLYRVTRDPAHLIRAVKLGTRFKRCLKLADGRYSWNYWEPAGPWDVSAAEPGKWKHWIGTEPKPMWYAASTAAAVMLYHHGVVFDKTDMKRFVRTQLEVCWNGDFRKPAFRRTDGAPGKGRFMAAALAPFDERIERFVYAGERQHERFEKLDNAWHGGVVADPWIRGKYIELPAASGGKRIYARTTAGVLSRGPARTIIRDLAFDVVEPGRITPMTPADLPATAAGGQ